MVDFQRLFTVAKPMEVVVDYLRDFAHAEEWDPAMLTCVRIGGGDLGVGTQWRSTSKVRVFRSDLTYTLLTDEPDHLVFRGENETATSSDDLSFEVADPQATVITYRTHVELNGKTKLPEPLPMPELRRLVDKTETQLTATLESLPTL